ncbi:MAG: DNA repair ATPase [Alphaproteobacteria bacterium]|nr:DNA repair ATPase [Alphaproteobacteria bacterium]
MSTEGDAAVSGGNYEVIRARLMNLGKDLAERANQLNADRQEKFGGSQLEVAANLRVRTANNCIPQDVVQVEGKLLFGYNVVNFLKKTTPPDVLSLHELVRTEEGWEDKELAHEEVAWLKDRQFVREFERLYEYYKTARLQQLRTTEAGRLLVVFQVGNALTDVKVFRWTLAPGGGVTYMDDRGEREHVFPDPTPFQWRSPGREDYIMGAHPHISILGECFVETVGGDLTIKIEDNTEDGEGIYSEPVDDAKQSLDDADIQYARLDTLILLKMKPYREKDFRYLVFNTTTRTVARVDALGHACVPLPEGHGIVFPGGYYLRTGEYKVFDGDFADLKLGRHIRAPNGEDDLFVFHRRSDGYYVLFPYNRIRQEVATPIRCHGYSLFEDGRLVVFRGTPSGEPSRVHPMQVWSTPFVSDEFHAAQPTDGSLMSRIGNADLVRGISEALSLRRLINNTEPTRQVYEDLVAACTRMLDKYYWLGEESLGAISTVVGDIRRTAELIIDEFEKVQTLMREARKALREAAADHERLILDTRPEGWREVEQYLGAMTKLRKHRGHLITLQEVRYIDVARVKELEQGAVEAFDRVSRACVDFLLEGEALTPMVSRLDELMGRIEGIERSADAKPLAEELEANSDGLNLLAEVVGGLEVDDANARTEILDGISEVFSQLNRVRAVLQNKTKELLGHENRAEFAAQFKLFGQSVSNAITISDSPERCDEQLSRLLLNLEELEARFGEFDEFLPQLAAKREEVYDALSGKKQQLLDARQRRVDALVGAASRILEGVGRRARSFKEEDELNAYYASDPMVLKLRKISEQLAELGDSVKSDELLGRLKTARQDALRGLRDRAELFEGADNAIRFGKHLFSVNTQPLELTMVPRSGGMAIHLTGTDFYEAITDEAFLATQPYWDQALISETAEVYRGEFLAASMLFAAERGEGGLSIKALRDATLEDGGLLKRVRAYAAERYEEGYERGLHDADGALILERLLSMRETAGLLRFPAQPRALACLAWAWTDDGERKETLARRARSLGRLRARFAGSWAIDALAGELQALITESLQAVGIQPPTGTAAELAGQYLLEELTAERPRFTLSEDAERLRAGFRDNLNLEGGQREFEDDMRQLEGERRERFELARAWVGAFVDNAPADSGLPELAHAVDEVAVALVTERALDREVTHALSSVDIPGMLGQHPRVQERTLKLRLDEFLGRLAGYMQTVVPGYREFKRLRHALIERERRRLRIDEFMPKVMSTFVRNKLINEVYLPVVGDNLAKQMGALGDSKRTDLMGLLLLISPPGYGKTTLMEYIANRLGLVFMKVNGPALGHSVHSLDPAEAPNATARQEVEKINLAFEMGNNVMLYLDDIQHTHPELLQKFISLCDGQRRIEGVWNGRTRTYDLRGKKFCVVMAGNPYTETGEKFTIPDMLANRADTYNLGEVLEGRDDAFALSYVENSLTSNPALAPLAARAQSDVYLLIRMAQGEDIPTAELSHAYSAVEIQEIKAVLERMFEIQRVVLQVNQEYVRSAAQEGSYRTEPPFKLQGSYRNMNKMAEKVVSAMNEMELQRLIDDHYAGESQTLTTGAEQNLLKLAELRGRQSEAQAERWEAIKKDFRRIKSMGGAEDDPVMRVTGILASLGQNLEDIQEALVEGRSVDGKLDALVTQVQAVGGALEAGRAVDGKLDTVAAQLQSIGGALTAGRAVDGKLDTLAARLAGVGEALEAGRGVDSRLDTLAAHLERLGAAMEAGRGVDSRLDTLAGHLEGIGGALQAGRVVDERLDTLNNKLNGIGRALVAGRAVDDKLDGLHAQLAAAVAALEAGRGVDTKLELVSEQLAGIGGVLREGTNAGLGASLDGLGAQLGAIQQTLERGSSGGLDKEVAEVGEKLATLARMFNAAALDEKGGSQLLTLSRQLAGLRKAVQEMPAPVAGEGGAASRAAYDPLLALGASSAAGGVNAEQRREAQRDLLSAAQQTLRGEAVAGEDRSAAMAASVRVIRTLVNRLSELSAAYVPAAEREPFMDDLRRHVALSLSELSED